MSPRPVDVSPFYDERYYNGGFPGLYTDYATYADVNLGPVWSERLQALRSLNGGTGVLLDIGTATGEFLLTARSLGWKVKGIELSEWASQIARERHSLDVLTGSLPHRDLAKSDFDAITMWDCIEHLSDPRAVLTEVYRLLRPNGTLVLSTGAVPDRDPKHLSKWYFPPWHLFYFSELTMRHLLERCGFVDCSVELQSDADGYEIMIVTARKRNLSETSRVAPAEAAGTSPI